MDFKEIKSNVTTKLKKKSSLITHHSNNIAFCIHAQWRDVALYFKLIII